MSCVGMEREVAVIIILPCRVLLGALNHVEATVSGPTYRQYSCQLLLQSPGELVLLLLGEESPSLEAPQSCGASCKQEEHRLLEDSLPVLFLPPSPMAKLPARDILSLKLQNSALPVLC